MDDNGSGSDDSDLETVVRALAAQLRKKKDPTIGSSSSIKYHCNFCSKSGHTEDRCFDNPSNPNNKLSPKIRQMIANVVQQNSSGTATGSESGSGQGKSSGKAKRVELAGTVVEKVTVAVPKNEHGTYADSGATVHCFHSKSAFVSCSITSCDPRTVMLADKSSVISRVCGEVILPFENANVRLRNVLYIPELGYNLVWTVRLAGNII